MGTFSQVLNTVSVSSRFCNAQDANYRGLDVECWCGNTPPPSSLYYPEIDKKCTFSCPLDTTQACGGNGGYISVFYDSLNYTPPNGTTVSSVSTVSSTILTSITVSTTTSTTSATTTTTSTGSSSSSTSTSSTTSTSSSTSTTATGGPSIVPSVGVYTYVGCYTEATTGRALTGATTVVNTMTVEECATFCNGFTWFGVEYHRECKFCILADS